MKRISSLVSALLGLILSSTGASAHVGVGEAYGFVHGFMHPIGGLDHILAMVAVGVLAAKIGGRALWFVPVSFVVMMAAGGALGIAQIGLPYVETVIAASVVILGFAIASNVPLPVIGAMALAGFLAVFHGHAHGAEMPVDVTGAEYAAGFMLATTLLHIAGIALGLSITRIVNQAAAARVCQVGGSAMTLAGLGLLSGWI